MDSTLFGKRLHEQRLLKKLTLDQLAAQADLTPNYLSAVERGVKKPSFDSLIRIINALNVSSDILLRDLAEPSSLVVANDEIHTKLAKLTPAQRTAASEILDTIFKNLPKLSE